MKTTIFYLVRNVVSLDWKNIFRQTNFDKKIWHGVGVKRSQNMVGLKSAKIQQARETKFGKNYSNKGDYVGKNVPYIKKP